MNNMNVFELQMTVAGMYYNSYKRTLEAEKMIYGTNALGSDNCFTFAEDMVLCLMDDDPCRGIDGYVNTMLNRFCKGGMQAYYEMILSLSLLSSVFNEMGATNLYKCCTRWYAKLFYNEDFYPQYISDDNIERLWRLR